MSKFLIIGLTDFSSINFSRRQTLVGTWEYLNCCSEPSLLICSVGQKFKDILRLKQLREWEDIKFVIVHKYFRLLSKKRKYLCTIKPLLYCEKPYYTHIHGVVN